MTTLRSLAVLATLGATSALQAQQTPPRPARPATPAPASTPQPPFRPRAAASTRATVEVLVNGRLIAGSWAPAAALAGPARLAIEYGQPHARGRHVFGPSAGRDTVVVPMDSVWRLGANVATQLTADFDVTIGGAYLPAGVYTLFALPSRTGWKLIISKAFGEWGTDYEAAKDFARIALRSRTLSEPVESLSIYLIPSLEPPESTTPPHGTLKIVWERTELTTDWRTGR